MPNEFVNASYLMFKNESFTFNIQMHSQTSIPHTPKIPRGYEPVWQSSHQQTFAKLSNWQRFEKLYCSHEANTLFFKTA